MAAGLALAAAPALARTFYVVQSGADSWTVMDAQGIEAIPDTAFRKAWAVRVQRNILSGNPPQPGYVRTLTEYDCQQTRTRWREFTAFSRSGATLVSKVNPNPEWGPAEEAGDTYAAYRVVCEGVGGGSVVAADTVAKVVIGLMASWDPPPLAAPPAALPPPKAPSTAARPVTKPTPRAPAPAKAKTP
ncbi:surface-adhesin E family protein [Phenylobacterium sp.]|uniref:surface-adhesin E family protein n=1 Tax=Phenylobacterium sp. TaxID=1871053 RepID=UPI0025F1D028|nr:surface-adhesin E family protein [Phenylobacterium sp.]